MLLVHGTSLSASKRILKDGIIPRGKKKSRWKVQSSKDSIYLSNAYAFYYALHAQENSENVVCLVEVDTSLFGDFFSMLAADEDALEQAFRISKLGNSYPFEITPEMTMEERTVWFSKNLIMAKMYGLDHNWSLNAIGNCTYIGKIPKEAITKISYITVQDIWWLQFFDPTITLANYLFIGKQYKAIQRIFMGDLEGAYEIAGEENRNYVNWIEELVQPNRNILDLKI